MAQTKKSGNKNNELQSCDIMTATDEELPETIAKAVGAYTGRHEIPILSEFCAEVGIYENFLLSFASEFEEIKVMIKILETKKQSGLERKIYAGELNATIGAHLLKAWREEKSAIAPEVRYVHPTIFELDELDISDEKKDAYMEVARILSVKKPKPIQT